MATLNSWETANKNRKEKHFTRIGSSFFDDPLVTNLTNVEFRVLLYMLRASAGKQEFTFSKAFYSARGISASSYNLAEKKLIEKGFIIKIKSGHRTREKNVYRWVDTWKR